MNDTAGDNTLAPGGAAAAAPVTPVRACVVSADPIKLVVFDLDGTLVDTTALHRDAFLAAFALHARGVSPPLTAAQHAASLEGLGTREKLRALRALYPGGAWDEEAVYASKQALLAPALAAFVYPALARAALGAAKARGLRVAIYTSTSRATLEAMVDGLGVRALLECAQSDEGAAPGCAKPSPAGYASLFARLGVSPREALVFEDSAPGLAAARGSGARVVRVLDPLDVTPAFVDACIASGGAPPPPPPRLRIVVPMAGLGSRFAKDGFVAQKPFLPTLGGRQLWEVVVENLMPKREPLRSATEVHLVVRAEQLHLFAAPPHVHLHAVPGLTEGAACTVLTLKGVIDDDVPLMVGNSDQFLEWDADAFYAAAFHPSYDGAISTFFHPCPEDLKWSYAALGPDGTVAHVAEKVYIGPHATTGLYAWKRGRDFVAHAEAMVAADERVNNEFYVAPVYNGCVRAGLRYRVVPCAKFWGVGVPDDYYAFLDKFVPPGDAPLPFARALARRYEALWCKWGSRVPVAQPDVARDPGQCAALWTTGAFHLTPAVAALRAALEPWAAKFQWFDEQPALGLARQGGAAASPGAPAAVLHHTLFQFRTFPVPPAEGAALTQQLEAWGDAARDALAALPPYYLTLTGVAPVRSGVVACGYPPRDYTPVRDAIRRAGPCREPHAQDIHHVTLLRWTAPLSASEASAAYAVLARFRDAPMGSLQPAAWHAGLVTWCVRPETVLPVRSWRAPPSPWVLHRGNVAGLAPETENDPAVLRARLALGWDVEVDLWVLPGEEAVRRAAAAASEGKGPAAAAATVAALVAARGADASAAPGLWLGHDAPAYALADSDVESLLAAPGVWVHCKNIGALAFLRAHAAGGHVHFFAHDADPLALTSRGVAWCYPDVLVPGPATVAVVWPHVKAIHVRPGVGVCADWLPHDVALTHDADVAET